LIADRGLSPAPAGRPGYGRRGAARRSQHSRRSSRSSPCSRRSRDRRRSCPSRCSNRRDSRSTRRPPRSQPPASRSNRGSRGPHSPSYTRSYCKPEPSNHSNHGNGPSSGLPWWSPTLSSKRRCTCDVPPKVDPRCAIAQSLPITINGRSGINGKFSQGTCQMDCGKSDRRILPSNTATATIGTIGASIARRIPAKEASRIRPEGTAEISQHFSAGSTS